MNSRAIDSKVYIDILQGELKHELQKGLEFIDWEKYITKDTRVFIKPNFTYPIYKPGVTTSPKLLHALVQLCKQRTDSITIGESDGGYNIFKAEHAFNGHDMYTICEENNVKLVNLSNLPSINVQASVLDKNIELQVPRMLLKDIDCFISVPVLKVHVMTTMSLSLKNLWGCIPSPNRVLLHKNLEYKIACLAMMLKPRISIIDGMYALNKHGPLYGKPEKLDLVILSNDPVAADSIGTQILGFSAEQVKHIKITEKAGLGTAKGDWHINGDWQQYRKQFTIERTIIDRLNYLTFINKFIARIVYCSFATPFIYKIIDLLRNKQEKKVVIETSKKYKGVKNY